MRAGTARNEVGCGGGGRPPSSPLKWAPPPLPDRQRRHGVCWAPLGVRWAPLGVRWAPLGVRWAPTSLPSPADTPPEYSGQVPRVLVCCCSSFSVLLLQFQCAAAPVSVCCCSSFSVLLLQFQCAAAPVSVCCCSSYKARVTRGRQQPTAGVSITCPSRHRQRPPFSSVS